MPLCRECAAGPTAMPWERPPSRRAAVWRSAAEPHAAAGGSVCVAPPSDITLKAASAVPVDGGGVLPFRATTLAFSGDNPCLFRRQPLPFQATASFFSSKILRSYM